jgi:hypothetical protein
LSYSEFMKELDDDDDEVMPAAKRRKSESVDPDDEDSECEVYNKQVIFLFIHNIQFTNLLKL